MLAPMMCFTSGMGCLALGVMLIVGAFEDFYYRRRRAALEHAACGLVVMAIAGAFLAVAWQGLAK